MPRFIIASSICLVLLISSMGNCDDAQVRRAALLNGRTIQVDAGFPYYQGRSGESIASEIELDGFSGVYLIVSSESSVHRDLINALQNRGIAVAAMFFASGVYASPDITTEQRERWKMKFTTNDLSQYSFFSYVHEDYREYMKKRVVEILDKFNFDGFTFAEIMYAIYDGPTRKRVLYGDVSEGFQEHFKKATGNKDFPDFNNPQSPNYFRKNIKLYDDLVKYRIKTINDFYSNVVNGKGGIREMCPGVVVATWSLAVNIPDGVEKLAEWEGDDAASMIKAVKPDIHFLQTHAPDWLNPALKSDYVKNYKPFIEQVRAADKNVKIGLQADIGSLTMMRKDPNWINEFYMACADKKIDTTTCYEFNVRWQVYWCAPRLKKAVLQKDRTVNFYFDKRISDKNANLFKSRIIKDAASHEFMVINARVDGNILEVELNKAPSSGTEIDVPLEDIYDDPGIRFKDNNPSRPLEVVNAIPAGTHQLIVVH